MSENFADTKAMANQLGVGVRTRRKWVRQGIIPVLPINLRTWRYDVPSVREALKARSEPQQQSTKSAR
jgi:predicted site-specific integrase-resolvase